MLLYSKTSPVFEQTCGNPQISAKYETKKITTRKFIEPALLHIPMIVIHSYRYIVISC